MKQPLGVIVSSRSSRLYGQDAAGRIESVDNFRIADNSGMNDDKRVYRYRSGETVNFPQRDVEGVCRFHLFEYGIYQDLSRSYLTKLSAHNEQRFRHLSSLT